MHFHNLIIRQFTRTDAPDLFEKAMRLRQAVFVEEQAVPADHELDALDETATHWIVQDAIDPLPVATGRMFPDPEIPGAVRVGRMAVRKPYRGQGMGRVLLDAMLEDAAKQGFTEAVCNAQTHALVFYQQAGFVAEGEEFMEEDIPHRFMRCALSPAAKEKASPASRKG